MNTDQMGGILRAVLPPLVAFATAKGWVSAGNADWLITGLATFAAAGWSWWTNKPGTVIPSK